MSEEITDESILRCTVKKSVSTVKRLAIFGGKAGLVIGILALVGYGLITGHDTIIFGIASVPWWIYVIAGISASVVLHSYFWCVNRYLTEKDYESDSANNFQWILVISMSCIAAATAFFVFSILFETFEDTFPEPAANGLLSFFISCLIFFVVLITPAFSTSIEKATLFPGAWYHHRKMSQSGHNALITVPPPTDEDESHRSQIERDPEGPEELDERRIH